jgi:hypothetical protein
MVFRAVRCLCPGMCLLLCKAAWSRGILDSCVHGALSHRWRVEERRSRPSLSAPPSPCEPACGVTRLRAEGALGSAHAHVADGGRGRGDHLGCVQLGGQQHSRPELQARRGLLDDAALHGRHRGLHVQLPSSVPGRDMAGTLSRGRAPKRQRVHCGGRRLRILDTGQRMRRLGGLQLPGRGVELRAHLRHPR